MIVGTMLLKYSFAGNSHTGTPALFKAMSYNRLEVSCLHPLPLLRQAGTYKVCKMRDMHKHLHAIEHA